MIFSSNKIIKIIKKNIEITFLFLLLLITISSTNIYNKKKVLTDENYKNIINNIAKLASKSYKENICVNKHFFIRQITRRKE